MSGLSWRCRQGRDDIHDQNQFQRRLHRLTIFRLRRSRRWIPRPIILPCCLPRWRYPHIHITPHTLRRSERCRGIPDEALKTVKSWRSCSILLMSMMPGTTAASERSQLYPATTHAAPSCQYATCSVRPLVKRTTSPGYRFGNMTGFERLAARRKSTIEGVGAGRIRRGTCTLRERGDV